ncbi:MAG: cell division FtsA domain-containing protein, partial [Aggregatilineales bacterium]
TQDMTYWMRVPFELAEAVKIQHGHSDVKSVNALETFLVEPFGDGMPQEISRRDLTEVIEARAEEIFEMVQKEIKRSGYDGLLRAGAVLTGGGSQLRGMQDVAARTLNCPVRLAKPEKLTGMADALKNPSYSTSVGLLRLGLQMESVAEPDVSGTIGVPGAGISSMLGNFFKRFLPDDAEE